MLDAEPISLTFGWSELTGRKNDHGAKWLDTEFSMRYMIIKHFVTFCIFYVDKRAVVFINMNPKFFERLNENTLKTRICHWTAEVTEEPKKLLVSGTFAGNFKMATDDRELFWQFVSNPWVSYSAETLVVIMDSDGIRRPPKPASQLSTALFLSPQLDLTPEKKTNKPKQNFQKNVSEAPTENTKESKEIYAWYVYCNGMLFL